MASCLLRGMMVLNSSVALVNGNISNSVKIHTSGIQPKPELVLTLQGKFGIDFLSQNPVISALSFDVNYQIFFFSF